MEFERVSLTIDCLRSKICEF